MFNDKDLKQFINKGISAEKIQAQINHFKKGFPYANIIAPATAGNGIIKLTEDEVSDYGNLYDNISENEKIVKFIPASGAASRMFKSLFALMNNEVSISDDTGFNSPNYFFKNIQKFAFYTDLKNSCPAETDFSKDFEKILNYLLTENGLNYGNLPKGLLKFHKYKTGERTPSEEHLAEGAMYAKTGNNVFIHFTVSPEHQALFEKHIEEIKVDYENRFEIKIHIKFSIQKPSTDTIAVDLHNQPFRNEDGTILFRPGGHGALIENLNDIDADIIFVKNIDNVVPDRLKAETVKYKKALGGLLKEKQTQIFNFTEKLQNDTSEETINIVKTFAENELYITLDNTFETKTNSEKARYLISKLNRPLRVCGMVKNEGEPGGGPFFVKKESGSVSLQIVESAQIDTENTEKAKIVKEATHFNPVDLVLAVKDFKGNKFDLKKYIDPKTGFISQKSKNGKELKALELPGLWNGAMANWNTLFVEVPISTFNPVKVINDLLRDTHQ